MRQGINVLGQPLQACSLDPVTGFFRDGCCNADDADLGRHIVCAVMTADFLRYSKAAGNDLSTPRLQWGFAGLKPGDRWCLCLERWVEALMAGAAPAIVLAATHEDVLERLSLETLVQYAVDRPTVA